MKPDEPIDTPQAAPPAIVPVAPNGKGSTTPPKLEAMPPAPPIENAVSSDPFALSKLRLPQSFLASTKVKKLLNTVPVGKPGPQTFFRVHPAPNYREAMAFLELKDERETYLVNLEEVPELESECFAAMLYTYMTRGGVLSMWPVRLPAADGRALDWHTSAMDGATEAMSQWVRIKSNMDLRAYETFVSEGSIPDPKWPDLTFEQIYRIAFKTRLINTPDHPVIKRLRGE